MKSPKILVEENTAEKGVGIRPVMLEVWMTREGRLLSVYLLLKLCMIYCVKSTVG